MEAVPAVAIEAVQTNQQNGGDAENEPLTPSGRSKRRASSSHTSSLLHMSALDSESLGEYHKKHSRRRKLAEEVLSTEKTYAESLTFICVEYRNPMLAFCRETKVLPESVVHKIFSNIDIIAELHCILLEQLKERMKTWSPTATQIGDIFLKLAPFLRLYTEYVNSYDSAVRLLSTLSANKKFNAFLKERKTPSAHIKGDWYLTNLLILPVQRIPRYEMFFKELVKETPEGHVDYADLRKCEETIKDLAAQINEAKRLFENCQKLWAIQSKLSFDDTEDLRTSKNGALKQPRRVLLVKPRRRLVREGLVWLVRDQEETQGMLFLFSDTVLMTKSLRGGEELQFVVMFNLFGASLQGRNTSSDAIAKQTVNRSTYERDLSLVGGSGLLTLSSARGTITFYTEQPEELQLWEEDFRKQIDKSGTLMTFSEILLLHESCKMGKEAAVRKYIAAAPGDINKLDAKGRTPLYLATKKGHASIVHMLLHEYHADPNIRNKEGATCLYAAITRGHEEVAAILREVSPTKEEPTKRQAVYKKNADGFDFAELQQMVMKLSDKPGKPPVLASSSASVIMMSPPPLPLHGWAGLGTSSRESVSQKSPNRRPRRASLFSKLPRSDSARGASSVVRKRGKSEMSQNTPALLKELERITEEKRREEGTVEKDSSKKKKEKTASPTSSTAKKNSDKKSLLDPRRLSHSDT